MVPMPLKLILLLVLAAVVLHGYSVAAQVAGTDNQQAATTQGVTILDPFELVDVTATVTETVEDPWWGHVHRHRYIRTPSKPPL
jgi:cytochrome oxidase Cu insertion factor (SCO1/SenC/PrrC family)